MTAVDVYVGNYDTYAIPAEVIAKAKQMSGDKWRTDRRTKGSRYVHQWGRNQDAAIETRAAIERNLHRLV